MFLKRVPLSLMLTRADITNKRARAPHPILEVSDLLYPKELRQRGLGSPRRHIKCKQWLKAFKTSPLFYILLGSR